MREIKSRTFYCPKVGETVTLVEYARCEPGCEAVCGILSCSNQEECAEKKSDEDEPVFNWAECPACQERSSQK